MALLATLVTPVLTAPAAHADGPGVGLYEEVGLASWQSPGAADRTEWVDQIRTVSTVTGLTSLGEPVMTLQ